MEEEENRAAVLEIDLASRQTRVFASGLRNPNGLAWNPENGGLWVVVNERDEIGSDLVPDYMTSVRYGGFYGWPYSYFGQHVDERVEPQNSELVAQAIKPDYALGPHTASLGLTFNTGDLFGPEYKNGAFIGQHGSWNRMPRSGYKVIFVPFSGGKPSGPPQDILTGFLSADDKAFGRPVGVKTGALLVADDVGNKVWRVVSLQSRRKAEVHGSSRKPRSHGRAMQCAFNCLVDARFWWSGSNPSRIGRPNSLNKRSSWFLHLTAPSSWPESEALTHPTPTPVGLHDGSQAQYSSHQRPEPKMSCRAWWDGIECGP